MFEPKQGEMILVTKTPFSKSVQRRFVCRVNLLWLCEEWNNTYLLYVRGEPLPTKPEPILFTHETWPKQTVHIRRNTWDANVFDLVTGRYSEGVTHDGDMTTFDELLYDHQMSLDYCRTWQPCHYVPDED